MTGMGVQGQLWQLAERLVGEVLDRGVVGFGPWRGAVQIAQEHLRAVGDPEEAIRRLVRSHVRLAASAGLVTGLGGMVTMPITVPAGVTGLYVVAIRMVAGIAHLRGYDVDSEEVRSAMPVCLLGPVGDEVLKRPGLDVGTRTTTAALKTLSGTVLGEINRRIGYRLVARFGERGAVNLGRLVPLVGGPIGATMDGLGCLDIASYAVRAFPAHRSRPVVMEGEIVEHARPS